MLFSFDGQSLPNGDFYRFSRCWAPTLTEGFIVLGRGVLMLREEGRLGVRGGCLILVSGCGSPDSRVSDGAIQAGTRTTRENVFQSEFLRNVSSGRLRGSASLCARFER